MFLGFYFFLQFYTDRIEFRILIVICEFMLRFIANDITGNAQNGVHAGSSSWVVILSPVFFVH